jgi:hypothetical protein
VSVAHGYTPGLRVTEFAVLRRERRLPLKGQVLVAAGDLVKAESLVARTELPGNVQTMNVASRLALDPAAVPEALTRPIGAAVRQGEVIARSKSLFGLVTNTLTAPCDGTIESVSSITGQLILREPPIPVEINAYVQGQVAEVLPGEGVVVECRGALLQGIFGVGGETYGEIAIAVDGPEQELRSDRLRPEHQGKVVVGGSYVSYDALMHARQLGVAAVVVGGFDDGDLRKLLGRDLGVAITGTEELGFTLVLTEGFGRIRMADRSWRLLNLQQGRMASVSGATQIRAGVMRPEILIPSDTLVAQGIEGDPGVGLEIGAQLRVIREPYFGRIGRVVELPSELQQLDTEAYVRVLVVEFADDGARALVPRANVELIAG